MRDIKEPGNPLVGGWFGDQTGTDPRDGGCEQAPDDGVDPENVVGAKQAGYPNFRVRPQELNHRLGERTVRNTHRPVLQPACGREAEVAAEPDQHTRQHAGSAGSSPVAGH